MTPRVTIGRRAVLVVIVGLIVLGTVPATAFAETRTGGSVTVGADETVTEDLTVYAGNVIIRGTVTGDLTVFSGNVLIGENADIHGNLVATAGTVHIEGRVGDDVTATGGNVLMRQGGSIGGNLEAAAGSIILGGSVAGNARLAGGSIRLTTTTNVDGDVEYGVDDGDFVDEGATIGGSLRRNDEIAVGGGGVHLPNLGPLVAIYGLILNLVVGALLLLVLPTTSSRVAERVTTDALRTSVIGFATLIVTPILLVFVAITIVGIPVTIAGLLLYVITVWIGTIYGRYAVGEWLLSYTDLEHRWVALLVGVIGISIVSQIPFVGGLVEFVVLVLGLGALTTGGYQYLQEQRGPATPATAGEEPSRA